jgi:hypothetical protein
MTEDKKKPNVNEAFPTDDGNTLSALQAKLAELESEEKQLELEERRINIELNRDKVAKMKQEQATRKENAQNRMRALLQQINNDKAKQANCSHMKGGTVTQANRNVVFNGGGTDATDYCVVKHVLPSGRLMILCLRCGLEEYSRDPLTGEKATAGFALASKWPTKNQNSGSSQFWLNRDVPTFANPGEIAKERA